MSDYLPSRRLSGAPRLSQALLDAASGAVDEQAAEDRRRREALAAAARPQVDARSAASAATADAAAVGEGAWSAAAFNSYSHRMSGQEPMTSSSSSCGPSYPTAHPGLSAFAHTASSGLASPGFAGATTSSFRNDSSTDAGPGAPMPRWTPPIIVIERRTSGGPSTHRTESEMDDDDWGPNGPQDTTRLQAPDPRDSFTINWDEDEDAEAEEEEEIEYDEEELLDFDGDGGASSGGAVLGACGCGDVETGDGHSAGTCSAAGCGGHGAAHGSASGGFGAFFSATDGAGGAAAASAAQPAQPPLQGVGSKRERGMFHSVGAIKKQLADAAAAGRERPHGAGAAGAGIGVGAGVVHALRSRFAGAAADAPPRARSPAAERAASICIGTPVSAARLPFVGAQAAPPPPSAAGAGCTPPRPSGPPPRPPSQRVAAAKATLADVEAASDAAATADGGPAAAAGAVPTAEGPAGEPLTPQRSPAESAGSATAGCTPQLRLNWPPGGASPSASSPHAASPASGSNRTASRRGAGAEGGGAKVPSLDPAQLARLAADAPGMRGPSSRAASASQRSDGAGGGGGGGSARESSRLPPPARMPPRRDSSARRDSMPLHSFLGGVGGAGKDASAASPFGDRRGSLGERRGSLSERRALNGGSDSGRRGSGSERSVLAAAIGGANAGGGGGAGGLPGGAGWADGALPGRPGEGELRATDPRVGRPERPVALLLLAGLGLSAAIGSLFVLLPAGLFLLPLPLAPARALYRAIANAIAASWFTFASALLEGLARVRLRVSGAGGGPRLTGERVAILLCNRSSRLDWLFLWPLACRMLCAGRLKAVLPEGAKRLPLLGWASQAFLFPFVSRHGGRPLDLLRIDRVLSYLVRERGEPVLLLLFPEAAALSPRAAADAAAAAAAQRAGAPSADGAPLAAIADRPTRHVPHPRAAAFARAVATLGDRLDAVYDATLWYERHPHEAQAGARPSEATLLRGTFPRTVSIHVDRFGRSNLPPTDDEEAVGAWLAARWAAKEALLERVLVEGAPPPRARRSHPSLGTEYRLALLGWGGACVLLAVGLCTWLPLLLYAAVGAAVFWLLTALAGGLDNVELALSGCVAPAGDGAGDGGATRQPSRLAPRSAKGRAQQF